MSPIQKIKYATKKIKYAAALVNWFADSLGSIPLPAKEDNKPSSSAGVQSGNETSVREKSL